MTIGCVVVAGFQIMKVEQETDFGSLFDDASVVQVFQPKGDAGGAEQNRLGVGDGRVGRTELNL